MTLLSNGLVPYHPSHWPAMRAQHPEQREPEKLEEALGVVLSMSAIAQTVMLAGQPEAIVGMMLTPEDGHPWIAIPAYRSRRFAAMVHYSGQFIENCFGLRRVLRVERGVSDDLTRLWLVRLGFIPILNRPAETWELTPLDWAAHTRETGHV